MGKKNKAQQKKAAHMQRTENKQNKKALKVGRAMFGDDNIDALLAEFAEQDQKATSVQITSCEVPSPRVNCSFVPHPTRDEIIIFGGEHFNGLKVTTFADMYVYNTHRNEFRHVSAPNCPPPRSGHQAVIVNTDNTSLMYVFGGDYTSPNQIMKHFNDLWCCDLSTYKWEQITSPDAPSPRSGHRMVYGKRKLYVFGGFRDNHSTILYFDDLYCFDLDKQAWTKLGPAQSQAAKGKKGKGKATAAQEQQMASDEWPSIRSGCGFVYHEPTNSLVLYGGYCTTQNAQAMDESSTVLSDLWSYNLEANRWSVLKQSGYTPAQRSGTVLFTYLGRIFLFGGVKDVEVARSAENKNKNQKKSKQSGKKGNKKGGDDDEDDDDTDIHSEFFNDLIEYDMKLRKWYKINLSTGTDQSLQLVFANTPLATIIQAADDDEDNTATNTDPQESEEKTWESAKAEALRKQREAQKQQQLEQQRLEDELEKQILGMVESMDLDNLADDDGDDKSSNRKRKRQSKFVYGRRSPMIAIKNGQLFVFGGAFEKQDAEIILNDLHYTNIKRIARLAEHDKESPVEGEAEPIESWYALHEMDLTKFSWYNEDDHDDDDDDDDDDEDDEDEDDSEDDGDDSRERNTLGVKFPSVNRSSTPQEYFRHYPNFWTAEALAISPPNCSDKDLRKLGFNMARLYFERVKPGYQKQGSDDDDDDDDDYDSDSQ